MPSLSYAECLLIFPNAVFWFSIEAVIRTVPSISHGYGLLFGMTVFLTGLQNYNLAFQSENGPVNFLADIFGCASAVSLKLPQIVKRVHKVKTQETI